MTLAQAIGWSQFGALCSFYSLPPSRGEPLRPSGFSHRRRDAKSLVYLSIFTREVCNRQRIAILGAAANEKDKLPGRLQRRCVPKSRDAGPVNFIGWFGRLVATSQ
jgi:hypothetical protein